MTRLENELGIKLFVRRKRGLSLTPAGLAIDTKARVLKEDGTAIENLYAAGDIVGSIEKKDGKPYGCGFAAATTYGWSAADTIEAEM